MLICENGATVGSLSAGCIEQEVAARAQEVLRTGESGMISFDTRKRFGCAGKIDIFIERPDESFFANLERDLTARRVHVAVTWFGEGEFAQRIAPRIRLFIVGDGLDSHPVRSLARVL